MNIIKKLILFITNIFNKQNRIKVIEEPKTEIKVNNKSEFINSLKSDNIIKGEEITAKKIETLVCPGDGLGIQRKIRY